MGSLQQITHILAGIHPLKRVDAFEYFGAVKRPYCSLSSGPEAP